jgi:hypothetical protein
MEPPLSDFERLLRNSRPSPRAEFVRDLERSLVRSVQPRRQAARASWWRRSPRLIAATGFATAIAALLLVLSIAGVGPFDNGGTTPAQADRQCSTVMKVVPVRRPVLKINEHGAPAVTYRVEMMPRPVIRCR